MKLSILFVDDEENILFGLRRMLYPMRNEWRIFYSNGGEEALNFLKENEVDVIISDIRMPGMDGTQLLNKVREMYPQIIRITLSGYADDNLALKNTKVVHQCLSKPTDSNTIKIIIERAYKLRQALDNPELLKVINSLDTLPSLPQVYVKLENEINSSHSSINNIANIISNDPVITAKILQLTNSAFFGLPTHISNIKEAINFLGINLIKTLVLTLKLFKPMDENHQNVKKYQEVWEHSLNVASISQKIANLKSLSKKDIENSYLGGLMHDIGKLILLNNYPAKKIEESFSETLHAGIGAYLLGSWGLPDEIIEAVAFHHDFDALKNLDINTTKVVCYANRIFNLKKIKADEISLSNIDNLINELNLEMEVL